MEFKLNKIDTDLRRKVNDMTKEGKVHSKNSLLLNKNKSADESEKKDFSEVYKDEQEKNHKKKVSVEAVKTDTAEIKAEKEPDEMILHTRGTFLDTRK